jgi:hypothetical protein
MTSGLQQRYLDEVVPALRKEFGYDNVMQVPRLSKIVLNIGLGEALTNAKALDAATNDLGIITGQKPIVTRARRSIAQFRVRTNNPIGAKVTLRGRAHVGLPRAPDRTRPAPHPRLPRRARQELRRSAATTRSVCASSWRSRKSITTRSTACAVSK